MRFFNILVMRKNFDDGTRDGLPVMAPLADAGAHPRTPNTSFEWHGIDCSGDSGTRAKFLGIVSCTQDAVNSAMKYLGPDLPYAGRIADKEKRAEVLSKLRFCGSATIAICIRSDARYWP